MKITGGEWELGGNGELIASELRLAVGLLGRRATEQRSLVLDALIATGRSGLIERWSEGGVTERTSVCFDVEEAKAVFDGTLGGWVAHRTSAGIPETIGVELATPLAASPPSFGTLMGNLAHDLVQWHLADAGIAEARGPDAKVWCDRHADAARSRIQDYLSAVVVRGQLEETSIGRRTSRSTGGTFELAGFVGWLMLEGDLRQVLPWLIALELRGGGKKKSFGLGEVRLRF